MTTLSTLGVVVTDGAIRSVGAHWTRLDQTLRKNLLIANDGRPRREASQTREIVLAGLRVDLVDLRLSPVVWLALVFGNTSRLALRASSLLLRRRRCSVGICLVCFR